MNREAKIKELSATWLSHLKGSRQRGTSGPKNPMPASKMVHIYNEDPFNWDIGDADIRAMCNLLRSQGEPIGSNTQGYWYATDPSELDEVIAHMVSRTRDMEQTIKMLKQTQDNMRKRIDSLLDTPAMKLLQLEFETKVVS